MADSTTTNYSFTLPETGASSDTWGTKLNTNWTDLDADLATLAVKTNNLSDLSSAVTALTNLGLTSTAAELNILDGVTSTAAELNILDGVTSTAAELNILDGVTASTAELNYTDGVTSAIQTQLDAKETADTDIVKKNVANTFSADQTFAALTETKTTKSSSFTPNLSTDGTLYSCTGTMTITMPSAEAGKSFTIIHATATSITWSGTIKWNGGAAPTAGSGIDIYVFTSDGSNWYGMQAGTGFA